MHMYECCRMSNNVEISTNERVFYFYFCLDFTEISDGLYADSLGIFFLFEEVFG